MQWTTEQLKAIQLESEKPILVSAAAGSGKTAVLTERILQRCLEEHCDPSKLLVVTFTEKAAANMRRRLEAKVRAELAQATDEEMIRKLQRLTERLPFARISTIHAFCLSLIREYAQFIPGGLDPAVTALDEGSNALIEAAAMDEVLTSLYRQQALFSAPLSELKEAETEVPEDQICGSELPEENIPFRIAGPEISYSQWFADFARMGLVFDGGLDDRRLREMLTEALRDLRSLPDYDEWIQRESKRFCELSENLAQAPFIASSLGSLRTAVARADHALAQLSGMPYGSSLVAGKTKTAESFRSFFPQLQEVIATLVAAVAEADQLSIKSPQSLFEGRVLLWRKAYEAGQSLPERPALRRSGKEEQIDYVTVFEEGIYPLLHLLTGQPKADTEVGRRSGLTGLSPEFMISLEELEANLASMRPSILRFFETVLLIDRKARGSRFERNRVNFSDFEQEAYRLLKDPAIARSVYERFEEIYIDEYQDTNNVQEAIIQAIGREKIFMVGDIKQSIYRFRHANPALFNGKMRGFIEGKREGTCLLLADNFRSHPAIIETVNQIFSFFLSEETGEINYDETQSMRAGRSGDDSESKAWPGSGARVRLRLLEMAPKTRMSPTEDEDGGDTEVPEESQILGETKMSREAFLILDEVRQALTRGVPVDSIAVLCFTNAHVDAVRDCLSEAGIPALSGSSKTRFDSLELQFLDQLTRLLDNPLQDLPLSFVLRSPIHGRPFNEAELMQIALYGRGNEAERKALSEAKAADGQIYFHRKLRLYCENGPNEALRRKLLAFEAWLSGWRKKASRLSIESLLTEIFEANAYRDYLSKQLNGRERLSDLELFLQWAALYENNIGHGLSPFVRYLERMAERKLGFEGLDQAPSAVGAVQVMTVHASKGLEFPLVILCGLSSAISRSSRDRILEYGPEDGLACRIVDPDEGTICDHPLRRYFLRREEARDRAERYRQLYVALTRAREDLVLTASYPAERNPLPAWLEQVAEVLPTDRLPARLTSSCKSFLELIAAALMASESRFYDFMMSEAEGIFECGEIRVERISEASLIERTRLEPKRNEREETVPEALDPSTAVPTPRAETGALQTEAESLARLCNLLSPELRGTELLQLPAKLTVSEIVKREQYKNETEPGEQALLLPEMADMAFRLRRSELAEVQSKSETEPRSGTKPAGRHKFANFGSAYGSLLHRILQHLQLAAFYEKRDSRGLFLRTEMELSALYRSEIERMLQVRSLTAEELAPAEEAEGLILDFVRSDLAGRIAAAEHGGRKVFRERPFTLAVPAVGLKRESSEITLVQGIVDLYFIDEDETAVLVDYKSDYIKGDTEERKRELQKRYGKQLEYYAEAIRKISGRTLKKSLIYLIRNAEIIDLE